MMDFLCYKEETQAKTSCIPAMVDLKKGKLKTMSMVEKFQNYYCHLNDFSLCAYAPSAFFKTFTTTVTLSGDLFDYPKSLLSEYCEKIAVAAGLDKDAAKCTKSKGSVIISAELSVPNDKTIDGVITTLSAALPTLDSIKTLFNTTAVLSTLSYVDSDGKALVAPPASPPQPPTMPSPPFAPGMVPPSAPAPAVPAPAVPPLFPGSTVKECTDLEDLLFCEKKKSKGKCADNTYVQQVCSKTCKKVCYTYNGRDLIAG